MDLMWRRQLLLSSVSSPPAPLDCPYITDGLIFWLDGIRKGDDPTKWVDLISGKEFSLVGCSFKTNAVTFGYMSYGVYPGSVSSDAANETIEACFPSGSVREACILYPPIISNKAGIGMIFGQTPGNLGYRIDGQSIRSAICYVGYKTCSLNYDTFVQDREAGKFDGDDYWSINETGNTYIGRRAYYTSNPYQYVGDISSIRIYNRRLSESEMIYNQTVDIERFNLT